MNSVSLFGMSIDVIDMNLAVQTVIGWCKGPRDEGCRYVVTPNVDHAVMYQTNFALREAYAGASLVLADGAPVVLASRFLRKALPERVAGSDLVPALFDAVSKNAAAPKSLRVFLLGAGPGVADRAAERIHRRWSGVEVVGTLSPPKGFEHDEEANQQILRALADCQPDLVLVGLGAPKQELWVSRHANQIQAKAALCIGATIDFLAGEKSRAPRWMQRLGLEWLHRMATEPSRLAKRYLCDAWIFPRLIWREWRTSKSLKEA
ncbi:MAG: WecB/TagA/CpsF family glycosyltransferase [Pirellulales bacterium]|nr:WecB/TagA/CpsF family glycosyltransferase [Pirellulales bacterium]